MVAGLGGDEELATKMLPKDFLPGCRRMTPGLDYLQALKKPNVTLHQCSIKRISEHTIHGEDGSAEDVDLIFCATGFDTSFIPPWSREQHY
jgi:cation diffusion facilitator CzcD-associated flavoprotein CzcO